ncbi:MAG: glycosyltransferase, partial [Armatimonadetes bacterium]|nr:glycosyltransferase [Armatimonadota bacterium]
SCGNHLLADPERCRDCLRRHEGQTGSLHAAERAISGAPSEDYVARLREALAGAAGVLVNNPLIANLLGPHAPHVSVATPGVDVAQLAGVPPPTDGARPVILFPSLWQEGIKGYSVLEEACTRLRSQGHDFEVRVAGPDPERLNEWTTCVGWYPQERLADLYGQADFVVVPSVCEEAFGIVAAEGSAAGRPVIASRIGGLQSTVEDGVTGLLFEPGNAEDLAAKLGTLLADADLRRRLGEAGRARASRRYAWDQVIRQAYEPVLARTWAEADTGRTMPTRERMASTTADATPKAKRRRRKGKKGKAKGGGRPTVSLCMIVKNEEAHLPRCLKSVAGVFDEVIIVDTGSEDRTKKIAREHGARVFDFPWIDDFSAARNASLAPATGEWVMWLDADDSLDEENRSRLRKALAVLGDSHMAYVMKVRCLPAGEEGVTEVDHVKLFRNLPQLRFEYRVHEQILPAIRRLGGEVGWTDVVITHHGYQDPAARRRKLERDQRILREELRVRPDDPFCLFNLGCIDQELGAHDEAISSLHRSIDLSSPRDSQVRKAYAMIVQMERERSRPEAALQAYDAARAHYPADPELLFQAGLTHRALGDYAGAEESFLAAMEAPEEQYFSSLDPSIRGYKARHNLAVLYLETGRPEQAEAQWREAVAEAPAFTPAWDGLCELLSRRQDWSGLRELATEAGRQARPDLARVIEARAHLVQRDFDAAVAALRAVLAADAGHETAQRLLTYALLQSGQWAEAEPALRRLVELAPDDAEARRNLAVLLHEGARQPEGSAPSTSERLRPSPPDP